jgi:hypothetical protein
MTSTYVLNNKSCEDYYRRFKEAIKSKDTFLSYNYQLKVHMKYRGIADGQYFQLIEDKDTRTIEDEIHSTVKNVIKSQSPEEEVKRLRFPCSYCGRRFETFEEVKPHIINGHTPRRAG